MSVGFKRKLKGNMFLGYRAIFAHPWKRFLSEDLRTGKERFLDNYAPEGCLPTTEADREILRGASRCIHCGLCDSADRALSTLPRTLYSGASQIPVSWSRAVPDLPHLREVLTRLDDSQLDAAEAVCPTRVPLRAIVGLLRRKLEELEPYQRRPKLGESAK